ncbi:MAG TPA: cobalamin-binding protein [Blastocatellia bacterium]|nr:cobalamin-binding protein [Blastocatellia bacterium]
MSDLRIISLIASATEIVCALGFREQLVGRSHECDYPPDVATLPVCTRPKFDVEGTSREIDERVKESIRSSFDAQGLIQNALAVYWVDAGLLEQLQATHIITQSQCEVCAVSLKDVEQAVCQITSSRPRIVSLEPNALSDIWLDINRTGDALGAPDKAQTLIDRLTERMVQIAEKAAGAESRPTVAYIEWIDPLMAGGNWMPELIEMAGGTNLFGSAGKHSPWMSWEQVLQSDPDIIFVSPCGFDIARTKPELRFLEQQPGWSDLKAVGNERVFVADGNQYFNRPGPRVAESLEILAETIHPELFNFRHEGSGWISHSGKVRPG